MPLHSRDFTSEVGTPSEELHTIALFISDQFLDLLFIVLRNERPSLHLEAIFLSFIFFIIGVDSTSRVSPVLRPLRTAGDLCVVSSKHPVWEEDQKVLLVLWLYSILQP